MAKIGLRNFLFGILAEQADGSGQYGVAIKPAKAISCNVQITNNEAEIHADDGLAESDYTFQSGTMTIGVDDEDITVLGTLLGHTVTNGQMIRKANDIAPYVGFGRIVTKIVNSQYRYTVEFLKKVKFSEPSQTDNTKGENVQFNTSELSGKIMKLGNEEWSASQTFNTFAEARTYLESFFGSATPATVSFNNNGGSGSYSSVSTYVGATIEVPNGSALTPPTGKKFIGWDTSSASTTADISGTYKVEGTVTLYAIYEDE